MPLGDGSCLRRTGHLFAVSGLVSLHRRLSLGSLPVPKQSDGASGVNSVAQSANLRDLAACAPWNPDIFFLLPRRFTPLPCFSVRKKRSPFPGDRRPADSPPSSGLRPELHDWHFLSAALVHAAEPAPGSHGVPLWPPPPAPAVDVCCAAWKAVSASPCRRSSFPPHTARNS